MLETLFNSKTRTDILNLYFAHPEQKFYAHEVAKVTENDPANIYRELLKLEKIGILSSYKKNNQKYFKLEKESAYFEGLKILFSSYRKSKEGEWILMEEMPDYTPQITSSAMNVFLANKYFKRIGLKTRLSQDVTIFKDNFCQLWFRRSEFDSVCKEIVEMLIENPKWADSYFAEIEKLKNCLIEKSNDLLDKNLLSLTNLEIKGLYQDLIKAYSDLHVLHWVHTGVDFGDGLLSEYLISYLKLKIKESNFTQFTEGDIFSTLTTPSEGGNISKEHDDLLKILDYIWPKAELRDFLEKNETRIILKKLREVDSILEDMIRQHADKYGWLGYGTMGPSWDIEYFVEVISSLLRQETDPQKARKNNATSKEELIKKQNFLVEELKIDETHNLLFEAARGMVFTKGIRKDAMFYSFSAMENLLREIGRRFFISLQQIRFLFPYEIPELLSGKSVNSDEFKKRSVLSVEESSVNHKRNAILTGEKATRFLSRLNLKGEAIVNTKMLLGTCACPGRVRAEIRIVNNPSDIEKMAQGNILVSSATNPDLVPAIRKAAGIITNIGGITCHAAIISRELNIPCIVGTKIATKVLEDGDVVDMDASHGKVIIIKKAR